jgi:hypothetical protein
MRQCDWKRGSHNGYMAPVTMWNKLSIYYLGAGPAWTLRLTASAEGSHRPAHGRDVLATRVRKGLGTDGVPCRGRKSRTAIQKCCACSRKSAFRDKGAANENPSRKETFSPRFNPRNCTESGEGFARKMEGLSRRRSGRGGKVFSEDVEGGGRRISIKASRPLDVSSSFFSTLSYSLRESCVFVIELTIRVHLCGSIINGHSGP